MGDVLSVPNALLSVEQKVLESADKIMSHNEELHHGTRKELQLGFANQLHTMTLSAKEMTNMRKNQMGINGLVEVSEEYGEPDTGRPVVIPVVYEVDLADKLLTFCEHFAVSYGLESEYKERTQIGLFNDAMAHCKNRYHNEAPKIPELAQGCILRLIRPESPYNKNEMDCFISLKAYQKEAHINFVAVDKGHAG